VSVFVATGVVAAVSFALTPFEKKDVNVLVCLGGIVLCFCGVVFSQKETIRQFF